MSDQVQVVIGLAGHIDHGKTALVKALTGVDTDTQVEEKRRGMTIDIGFAFLNESITLVDVPGHDRYVKNMVRGAAGIHMGLLVVAADDGVMPQTREHFHILRLLGVSRLCVALTKADLAEEAWLELVEDDIHRLIAGTSFEGSPIVRVSAVTASGLEELRKALIHQASTVLPWKDRGFFRLPIDRVFSLKGFGTIVTGTVISGKLTPDSLLVLLPGELEVKLRGIQSHGVNVKHVSIGDRAALNVSNRSVDELIRGGQLVTPGYMSASKILAVDLSLLDSSSALPHNHPVRLNVGTAEVVARAKLVDQPTNGLQPGEQKGVLLELQEPVPVTIGDRFILRSFSPITTIGGGTVLDVEMPSRWKEYRRWVSKLAAIPEEDRVIQFIKSKRAQPLKLMDLSRRWGLSEEKINALLPSQILRTGQTANPWLLTPSQAEILNQKIRSALETYHQANPYSRGASRELIRQKVNTDERFIDQWLKELEKQGQLKVQDETWSLFEFDISLSPSDNVLMDQLIKLVKDQGFETENLRDLATRLRTPVEKLRTLCSLAENQGELVQINQQILVHRQTIQNLLIQVEEHFKENRELTVTDMKNITGTTRKYSVPLLEFLDRNGHTIRVGDKRVKPDG